MKKRIIFLLIISLIFISGCSDVGVVDDKLFDKDREKYILDELKKKHNLDFKIELIEKEELKINCNKKSCESIDGAFVYTYNAKDYNGFNFEVVYTDGYVITESNEKVKSTLVSYYDDVVAFDKENNRLINEYENIIKKYTTVYKRLYKNGYLHYNYYDTDKDNFGYIYFIVCNDHFTAKDLYIELNNYRRKIEQSNGSQMTIEFYFMKEWGLFNMLDVNVGVDPSSGTKSTLEALTNLHEQTIGSYDGFNLRMYRDNIYNIKEEHYYRNNFKYVCYYINDGDFKVLGLNESNEDVKPVIIKDYSYEENITPNDTLTP